MKQVIVYWSGTGNTEDIANKIKGDLGCDCFNVSNANVDDILSYDTIILGCPAMGAEELEEEEFKPFYDSLMAKAASKNIALFGSYGWGDGEWMRLWVSDVKGYGCNLLTDGLIVNGDSSAIVDSEYEAFINALK
ncbi:MAG: flavodoxin domain-containing protein [Acholeplasmatales bacterium]|nr:flavodoxin domain-containing protein [Acholeplasmatales bacterium]